MKKIILNEDQLKRIVKDTSYKSLINEYGQKGKWKSKWDRDDAILSLYVSLFGIERLGISMEDLARNIIGSSVASLVQQTSNFDFLDGRGGQSRKNELQTSIYYQYGKESEQKLRKMCLAIIDQRENHPKGPIKQDIDGDIIGNQMDDIKKAREKELKKKGKDPSKYTFQSRRQLHPPVVDDNEYPSDDENIEPSTPDINTVKNNKEHILDFVDEIREYINQSDFDVTKIKEYLDLIKYSIEQDLTTKEADKAINEIMKKSYINESDIKIFINKMITEQSELDELDYETFGNDDRLEGLRNAINQNKTVSVAFVKKDGSVRHMGVRRTMSSYVGSENEKTEKQQDVQKNNDIKYVIDINLYIKTLKETGDKEMAARGAWRAVNLKNVLGFMVNKRFVDLRDENDIMNRFGEEVYNSLTKSMVNAMQQEQNQNEAEINENINHTNRKKTIRLTETEFKNLIKRVIKERTEEKIDGYDSYENYTNQTFSTKDEVLTLLKSMNRDLERANSGNFAHMSANIRGGVSYLIEIITDDLIDKPQDGM